MHIRRRSQVAQKIRKKKMHVQQQGLITEMHAVPDVQGFFHRWSLHTSIYGTKPTKEKDSSMHETSADTPRMVNTTGLLSNSI